MSRRGQIRRLRRLADHALAEYRIEPAAMSLLNHSYNTTFVVIGPEHERYVLHILRPLQETLSEVEWRTRVESELWWLDRVRADLHVSVPDVVRTREGRGAISLSVEGIRAARVCTLFRWLPGRFLRHRFTAGHLEAVGVLTATLHDHNKSLRVPAWFDRPRVDGADIETENHVVQLFSDRVSTSAADVMRQAFELVRGAQLELGSGPDVLGLIHADIHQYNYMFSGQDVRLIDFGDCGWGHYLYDLAVTLSELADLPHRAQLREALLAGYRRVRDLSSAHEALIPAFLVLREVQNLTWFVTARDDPSYRARAARIEASVSALAEVLRESPGSL